MQPELIARAGRKSIRTFRIFFILMASSALFFLIGFVLSVESGSIGGSIVCGLLALAGGWQSLRIFQNLKLKDGILTIDANYLTWELHGQKQTVLLSDIHELNNWCGFTTLKDAHGRKLIAFPECQENPNKVLDTLTRHLRNRQNPQ